MMLTKEQAKSKVKEIIRDCYNLLPDRLSGDETEALSDKIDAVAVGAYIWIDTLYDGLNRGVGEELEGINFDNESRPYKEAVKGLERHVKEVKQIVGFAEQLVDMPESYKRSGLKLVLNTPRISDVSLDFLKS